MAGTEDEGSQPGSDTAAVSGPLDTANPYQDEVDAYAAGGEAPPLDDGQQPEGEEPVGSGEPAQPLEVAPLTPAQEPAAAPVAPEPIRYQGQSTIGKLTDAERQVVNEALLSADPAVVLEQMVDYKLQRAMQHFITTQAAASPDPVGPIAHRYMMAGYTPEQAEIAAITEISLAQKDPKAAMQQLLAVRQAGGGGLPAANSSAAQQAAGPGTASTPQVRRPTPGTQLPARPSVTAGGQRPAVAAAHGNSHDAKLAAMGYSDLTDGEKSELANQARRVRRTAY